MEPLLSPSSSKRDQIRIRVEKRVEAFQQGYRQNIGLIGAEGLGKTYLLSSFFESLVMQPNLIVIYIDAQALDYDHLVERWIDSLLRGFLVGQSVQVSENSHWLLTTAAALIPNTVEKIRRLKKMLRRGERNAISVRELFSLTRSLAEETQKRILLMIDEFHALEHVPASDPFALLGKEIMVEKETLYLVTSSRVEKAREIFHDKLSLLFGNFEIIELAPLDFEETVDFLKKSQPHRVFTNSEKKFLIRMTNGIPAYLDLLMDRLDMNVPNSETSIQTLLDVFHRELFDKKGRLCHIFQRRLEVCERLAKDSSAYLRTLLAMSDGRRKVLSIATYIERKIRETKKILGRLVQEGMVLKRGSFYVLEDSLFRFWLREVFGRRNQLCTPNGPGLREGLLASLKEVFEQGAAEDKVDVTARAEALFKEFRNDVVEIDQRRLRCPHFSEIAFRPANGRLFPLIARRANVRWICQIARESVHEEDISLFLEELKRFRKKVQRKILVALAGIDQNAKLLAQEAEIQLWDLRSFNTLLDLYNLPKMILIKEPDEPNLGTVAESVSAT
jgi:hypothetical protein